MKNLFHVVLVYPKNSFCSPFLVTDWVLETWVSSYGSAVSGNRFKARWAMVFVFWQILGIFADFSLRNFKKSSNIPKIWQKMKKCLVQFALKTHFYMELLQHENSISVIPESFTISRISPYIHHIRYFLSCLKSSHPMYVRKDYIVMDKNMD